MLSSLFRSGNFQAIGCRLSIQSTEHTAQQSILYRVNNKILAPAYNLQSIRFATKIAGGSVRNGRDSIGKRLGVKKLGGQKVQPGSIIIRQRGKTYHNGENTKLGRDYTLYSVAHGYVHFFWNKHIKHQIVSVTPTNSYLKPKVEQMAATEII